MKIRFWLILWALMACFRASLAQAAPDSSGGVTAVSAASTSVSETGAGPIAEISEAAYDFGNVQAGHQYEHAFKVRNAGNAVLLIQKVAVG